MFRHIVAQLAKKKVAPAAHRRPLRRASGAGGARRGAARATSSRRLSTKVSAGSSAAATGDTALAVAAAPATAVEAGATGHIPQVVDIVSSRPSYRLATAVSTVLVPPAANAALEGMKQILTPAVQRRADSAGGAGSGPVTQMEEYYTSHKGPLFATAVIAGTSAVKQSSTLIPFCHPTPIHKCSFTFRRRLVPPHTLRPSALPHQVVLRKRSSPPSPVPDRAEYSVLYCFCTVATEDFKSGVEMEALTGATVASITLYDMLKSLPGAQEDGLGLGEAFILAKRGGKNDFIKLLVSEPDRPGTAAAAAAVPTRDTEETAPAARGEVGTSLPSDSATAQEPPGTSDTDARARDGDDDEVPDDADEPTPSALARRVGKSIRVKAAAAATTPHRDVEPSPGDTGAWWRTSKHERRLHEQFPRRKYGDGARLAVPPVDKSKAAEAPASAKRAAGKRKDAADDQDATEEAEEDEETNAVEEEEVEEEPPAPRKATASARKALKKSAAKAASSRADAADDGDEDEEADENTVEEHEEAEEEEEAAPPQSTRASRKAASGKAERHGPVTKGARKASGGARSGGKGVSAAVRNADNDDESADGRKGKKKPVASTRKSTSKLGGRASRADDETSGGHEEEEEEEEEVAAIEPIPSKSSRSSAATNVKKKKVATGSKVSQSIRSAKHTQAEDEEDEETFEPVNHAWDSETVVDADDESADIDDDDDDEPKRAAAPKKKKKLLKKKKRGTR